MLSRHLGVQLVREHLAAQQLAGYNVVLAAPWMSVSLCVHLAAGTSEWLSTHSFAVLISLQHGDQSALVQATFATAESWPHMMNRRIQNVPDKIYI